MGEAWICIPMCAFRHKMYFSPPFLHLGDKHVFMINMLITNGMYLTFFFCPAQSLLWVYLVWVLSQCSLEVLYYFPALLGVDSQFK